MGVIGVCFIEISQDISQPVKKTQTQEYNFF